MANTKEEILGEIQAWKKEVAAYISNKMYDKNLSELESRMEKVLADNPTEVSWLDRCEKKAKALTREKRRKFFDLMGSNITVGAACETCGIDCDTAIGIVSLNHSLFS